VTPRRRAIPLCLLAALLAALASAPSAFAKTQRAREGMLTATFSFAGHYPHFSKQRLEIARGGHVIYDRPVRSRFCGHECAPMSSADRRSSVQIAELEGDGSPSIVLSLYSGGAHCCSIVQVFSHTTAGKGYRQLEHDFGDPGMRLEDLGGDGRDELVSADDSFAYEFSDYAASGLPLRILELSEGHFRNVTGSYPALIAADAASWLQAFESTRSEHYEDSVGLIAAWAADEDELGHSEQVEGFLAEQLRARHLNTPLSPQEPGGRRFIRKLDRFLRRRGYLR
jgi:hypothetical protein